jgi:catechol 2,3-dioxygenase-like lactoylglutathione lyase family enzyme
MGPISVEIATNPDYLEYSMSLETIELKAFVPAKNFERSKRFYIDLGFRVASSEHGVAYLHAGDCSFLLQDFYEKALAENLMMHLLVADVDAWWAHVQAQGLSDRYDVTASAPENRPWGMRDFTLHDPSGVLWRIGSNLARG